MTLTFNPLRVMIMTHDLYLHSKVQGQRPVGSEDEWKQTDRWTEAISLPPTLTRSVTLGLGIVTDWAKT